jgi:predicted lipoprotein with Yx(FWY)xxD motif
MKKNTSILIGAIAIIAIVAIGFANFYKSPKTAANISSSNQSASPTVNNAVLTTKNNSALGLYMVDPSGKALYIYRGDSSGVSNCTGSCLVNWPAYLNTSTSTNLPQGVSTIKRTDNGQTQYTYMGMPLYYFARDSQGQVTGNGVNNFSVATPAAASTPQPTTNSSPANPY